MKNNLTFWLGPINAAKQSEKDSGRISGDADIAAAVSEILEANALPPVSRGAVNHWLKGIRHPSIAQFIALCSVLNIEPSDVFGTSKMPRIQASPDKKISEAISLMAATDDSGKDKAIGGIRAALQGHVTDVKKTA